jgi:hypothetical protein
MDRRERSDKLVYFARYYSDDEFKEVDLDRAFRWQKREIYVTF